MSGLSSSSSPHRKQIQGHRKGSDLHPHHKDLTGKACTHSLWTLSEACSKIIPRCSQSTMATGREMGSRNFKSKHRGHLDQRHAAAVQEKNELSPPKKSRYWSTNKVASDQAFISYQYLFLNQLCWWNMLSRHDSVKMRTARTLKHHHALNKSRGRRREYVWQQPCV